MAVAYVETFEVDGRTYGIEDYEDGRPMRDHFFPEKYQKGNYHRFRLWAGGCGLGPERGHKTMEGARRALHAYITQQLADKRSELDDQLRGVDRCIKGLGADPFNLGKFRRAE